MLKIQFFYPTPKNMKEKKTTVKKRTIRIPFYTKATNKLIRRTKFKSKYLKSLHQL